MPTYDQHISLSFTEAQYAAISAWQQAHSPEIPTTDAAIYTLIFRGMGMPDPAKVPTTSPLPAIELLIDKALTAVRDAMDAQRLYPIGPTSNMRPDDA